MTRRRPEPVGWAQAATAAVPIIVSLLVGLGVIDWSTEAQGQAVVAITALVTAATAATGWLAARRKVTPLTDPRDDRGRELIPVPDPPPPIPPRGGR